ncbi:MAG TPA: hypothetical protein VGB09_01335 [Candidatus Binatia bacterium]
MLYILKYAGALRCIGQVLQNQNTEVFELKTGANEFLVQCGDPNPPYTTVIQRHFSLDSIEILDREAQARRRQSKSEIRFDRVPEILRAVGEYLDDQRGQLRRLNNCCLSDDGDVEIEYETRAGDIRSETLTMSFIREAAVRMYKRRTHLSNPISMLTRER